jgi:hypothetical protein
MWNVKALEHGATREPYEKEKNDIERMIKWGDEALSNSSKDVEIRGISVGSLRYIKAALLLSIKRKEEQVAAKIEDGWPDGVISSFQEVIIEMKKLADKIKQDPSDILWQLIPKESQQLKSASIERKGTSMGMEWDVFISHAGEDREEFVNPLVSKLEDSGLKVWYSESTLKVGDSLRRSIDIGLAHSHYGIVVISPAFLSKDWPQKELDGLAALEVDGRKVILPIWHKIEVDEVRRYSPTLADRVATSSKKGLEQVVADLWDAMELGTIKQNIAEAKSQSNIHVQENLTEEELKLLLAVEKSGNSGCYFPSLVQTLGISKTRTKYYLDKLSHDKDLLNWIGNMNPGIPDRYTLTRKGRDFLVEGGYV